MRHVPEVTNCGGGTEDGVRCERVEEDSVLDKTCKRAVDKDWLCDVLCVLCDGEGWNVGGGVMGRPSSEAGMMG